MSLPGQGLAALEHELYRCPECGHESAVEESSLSGMLHFRCQAPECAHEWDVSEEATELLSTLAAAPDGPVSGERAPDFRGTKGHPLAGSQSRRALATPAASAGEPPRPLYRELPTADPFPFDALGDLLGPAARAILERTQAPDAICAQSVLAAAALTVQGFADVELPTDEVRPVSCFFVSVASTGERKTSVDQCATAPARERERRLGETYARDRHEYEMDLEVWEQQRRQVLNNRKTTREAKRAALEALGARPNEPLTPLLTCPEPTFEGLTKLFAGGWPSLGVFSSEGGQFIGGHGMNQDNRLKTAAALSGLWDGEPLKRVRAGEAPVTLPGRRLALHLLVQPGVGAELLSDPVLADQGLLSRLLVAAPRSKVGTRYWREPSDEAERSLGRYQRRLSEILARPLPMAEGCRNELSPRTLQLSSLSRELWIEFANYVEEEMAPGGQYESIRGLANKLPEHAARLAGVIALVRDTAVEEISERELARGVELAKFYAHEALRLFQAGSLDADLVLAENLLQWLKTSWPEELVSLPDIYQRGPNRIRDKSTARKLVRLIEDHGWLEPLPEGAEVAGTKRREVWRIVKP